MKGIKSSGFLPIIAQAIAEMEEAYGEFSSLDQINLAELERRTGLSRSKLHRLKLNGFQETSRTKPQSKKEHILDGYSSVLNTMLTLKTADYMKYQKRIKRICSATLKSGRLPSAHSKRRT